MAESGEGGKVAPRPAAEIQNGERWLADKVAQQRVDVLADIVVARAGAKLFGALVVVGQRQFGDLRQLGLLGAHCHSPICKWVIFGGPAWGAGFASGLAVAVYWWSCQLDSFGK